MKRGFTLIEISIVLVIIGLLVGGLLVGQSLIKSAEISATISQLSQFDSGTNAFVVKYKYLPGDAPSFGGDGDGLITRLQTWPTCFGGIGKTVNNYQSEMINYWSQIMPNNYKPTSYAAIQTYRNAFSGKVPFTKIGIKNGFFVPSAIAVSSGVSYCVDHVARENYYVMASPHNYPAYFGEGGHQTFHSVASGSRTLAPADLYAIDKKIDDAKADSGFVLGGSYRGSNSGISKVELATCSSSGVYNLNNTGYECTPIIRIGGISGNPK